MRGDSDFVDGSKFELGDYGQGRFVGTTGGIGYRFGDFITFGTYGASTASTTAFEVKVEVPYPGFRIKDSLGKCVLGPVDTSKKIFSTEFESLRLGVNRIMSCNFIAKDLADFNSQCGKLSIQSLQLGFTAAPKFGIADLDKMSDWVTTQSRPLTAAAPTSGVCNVSLPSVTLIYQKFGRQNNFKYRISSLNYKFNDR